MLYYFNFKDKQEGSSPNSKGFTLVELLVVIAIVGLLTTVILVSVVGTREQAYETIALQNQANAKGYCAANPGVSTLNGDTVYCDEKYVMWSITLAGGGTFQYKTSDTALPEYANGNCNNLTPEDMASYPACNACRTLSYAGFSEGWQLPSQGIIPPGQTTCNTACGRDGTYCAPNRQLWDFGAENCSNWKSTVCDSSQGACLPSWDPSAVAGTYWSSTQSSATDAWLVNFSDAATSHYAKSTSRRVRCVLGQYW